MSLRKMTFALTHRRSFDGPAWRISHSPLVAIGLCIVLASLLAACGGQAPTNSGFLPEYESLRPTKRHADDLIFVDPSYDRARYGHVVVEEVAWQPVKDAPERDPQTIQQLRLDMRNALIQTLRESYSVSSSTGHVSDRKDVLRVRSAITNTRRANWYVNAPAILIGLPPPNPGGASLEIEVLDAATGKRVAAIATFSNGMPWNIKGQFVAFEHARRAFKKASELLRDILLEPQPPTGG